MFSFPPQTAFGKVIPKSQIYTHAAPSRREKELCVSRLSEIVWASKLKNTNRAGFVALEA